MAAQPAYGSLEQRRLLSVAEVLQLPVVRRALPEVVAGCSHVTRPVRWAHVLDLAEVSGLLKGGEFVLSSGLGLATDARTQRSFIRQLAEQDAAAVAVELGSLHRGGLPEPLRLEAERHRLPLIALHRRTRFVEVTEAVHQRVMLAEYQVLREVDDASRRLTEMAVDGAPLQQLLAHLARSIGNPVLLEDGAGTVVDWAGDGAESDIVLRAWEDLRRAELHDEAPRGAQSAGVRCAGGPAGRLVALELVVPLNGFSAALTDRGAEVLSLQLASRHPEDESALRSRGALLDDLILGRLSESEAARQAQALSFSRRSAVLLPMALTWPESTPPEGPGGWPAVAAELRAALARVGIGCLVGVRAQLLLMLIDPGRDADRAALAEQAVGALRRALAASGLDERSVAISVGPLASTWAEAGPALDRATRHAAVSAHQPSAHWHDASKVGLDEVLNSVRKSPTIRAFITDQLGPLLEADERRRDELLKTLDAHLRHVGRKTEAARELHLERQSMYHRLKRISALLDVDWSDGDRMLELHLALRARELLASSAPSGS